MHILLLVTFSGFCARLLYDCKENMHRVHRCQYFVIFFASDQFGTDMALCMWNVSYIVDIWELGNKKVRIFGNSILDGNKLNDIIIKNS